MEVTLTRSESRSEPHDRDEAKPKFRQEDCLFKHASKPLPSFPCPLSSGLTHRRIIQPITACHPFFCQLVISCYIWKLSPSLYCHPAVTSAQLSAHLHLHQDSDLHLQPGSSLRQPQAYVSTSDANFSSPEQFTQLGYSLGSNRQSLFVHNKCDSIFIFKPGSRHK